MRGWAGVAPERRAGANWCHDRHAGTAPGMLSNGLLKRRGRWPAPPPQACHELVPPETLAPVLRQLVDQFVHDRCGPVPGATGSRHPPACWPRERAATPGAAPPPGPPAAGVFCACVSLHFQRHFATVPGGRAACAQAGRLRQHCGGWRLHTLRPPQAGTSRRHAYVAASSPPQGAPRSDDHWHQVGARNLHALPPSHDAGAAAGKAKGRDRGWCRAAGRAPGSAAANTGCGAAPAAAQVERACRRASARRLPAGYEPAVMIPPLLPPPAPRRT